jgi:hypothetical protein
MLTGNGVPAGPRLGIPLRWLRLPKGILTRFGKFLPFAYEKMMGWGMLLPRPGLIYSGWRTSSYSLGNGECIEVTSTNADVVMIRDSKNPHGGNVLCGVTEWRSFVSAVKSPRES